MKTKSKFNRAKLIGLLLGNLFLLSLSCKVNGQDFLNQEKMNNASEFRAKGYYRIGVAFRHHGPLTNNKCVCPGCVCSGCPCPIGVCICSNAPVISLGDNDQLTQTQIDQGYGSAWVKIVNNQLHMVFEMPNDDNGILPIDSGPNADDTNASKFGVASPFTIGNNDYTVYKTKYTYGEVVLSITY